MNTGGKRMRTILESGKIKPNVAGQVLDLYNQSVNQGISPTIRTTIDSSNMIFVIVMKEKQLLYTSVRDKGKRLEIW